MGVNNLPGVATQQCTGWESNLRPLDHKSNALPLHYRATILTKLNICRTKNVINLDNHPRKIQTSAQTEDQFRGLLHLTNKQTGPQLCRRKTVAWYSVLTPKWRRVTHSPSSHVFDVYWRRRRHVPGSGPASWRSALTVFWRKTMKLQPAITNERSSDHHSANNYMHLTDHVKRCHNYNAANFLLHISIW